MTQTYDAEHSKTLKKCFSHSQILNWAHKYCQIVNTDETMS